MENDGSCKIIGLGNIILETNTHCKLILKDARHVPDIHLYLILAANSTMKAILASLAMESESSQKSHRS